MTVSILAHFRSVSNKFPTIFRSLIFLILLPWWGNFFVKERKRRIVGFKNVMERGIRKILTFAIC